MGANLKNVSPKGAKQSSKVVVASFASCFGCQLQITNAEAYLCSILGQIDLEYWQLTTSADVPEAFDVLIVEGAITTNEAKEQLVQLASLASTVIAIGACAVSAGIPAMALGGLKANAKSVYETLPNACGEMLEPAPVSKFVNVDYEVRGCPIDTMEFVEVLQSAIYGSNKNAKTQTMCADCKRNNSDCFFASGTLCMGLVTQAGCKAKCVAKGRPCNGCRGVSKAANLESARQVCKNYGVDVEQFNDALQLFNKGLLTSQTCE